MDHVVFLVCALAIFGGHIHSTDGFPNKVNTLHALHQHSGGHSSHSHSHSGGHSGSGGKSSELDLDSMLCGFEVDDCGFTEGITDLFTVWRRLCDNGCSMRSDAKESVNGQSVSTLVSPWFYAKSGVVQMRYRLPDRAYATLANISVYVKSDASGLTKAGSRELIYLASSEMDRPWVPMADEMDRPWVPMSVNVKMDEPTRFRFEIEGLLENSLEDIFIDDFEFKPKH